MCTTKTAGGGIKTFNKERFLARVHASAVLPHGTYVTKRANDTNDDTNLASFVAITTESSHSKLNHRITMVRSLRSGRLSIGSPNDPPTPDRSSIIRIPRISRNCLPRCCILLCPGKSFTVCTRGLCFVRSARVSQTIACLTRGKNSFIIPKPTDVPVVIPAQCTQPRRFNSHTGIGIKTLTVAVDLPHWKKNISVRKMTTTEKAEKNKPLFGK